ncbi:MAG: hypothetical protein A2504_04135 [Bdellovibrionales bacterium RIFOXYD12_FULL_39_22]|nr:MAG: hypothetical protein A2385_11885 [Bdellovibrionales bacterium RIFOXYB1_FULL_39_21]OFZ41761.1 MAG: hypothetical protein A2485_02195 [Bdellovibrionales bacterium RIFOXYC12_FULL_39_17]OFZ46161.1 MAG: hypothetical protein A2404_12560 [Bdellovibrionales bacterium RIFOXYC1_FULL_39_130]OFZ74987.1 MAG: hypothetical protein A2560_15600 [Bdellovibrionales bacterium RIFOXYD1_FULL_39_84]OFZ92840.1 MAG: hypothetical protein A2504_04135 [Bdellovibrionales bacterium RIFOXYD12_FULL_39_22]HLE12635.1 hy
MKIQQIIIEKQLEEIRYYFKEYLKKKIPREKQNKYRERFESFFNDDKKFYKAVSCQNEILEKFVCANVANDFGRKFIFVSSFYFSQTPSKEVVLAEIRAIRNFFPKVKQLSFYLKNKDEKLVKIMKKMNFHVSSWEYVGSVADGLKYLNHEILLNTGH